MGLIGALHLQAMVVHPDKNMGIPLASESFKKLQCAYEVSLCVGKMHLALSLNSVVSWDVHLFF